jgi:hypothetical protein
LHAPESADALAAALAAVGVGVGAAGEAAVGVGEGAGSVFVGEGCAVGVGGGWVGAAVGTAAAAVAVAVGSAVGLRGVADASNAAVAGVPAAGFCCEQAANTRIANKLSRTTYFLFIYLVTIIHSIGPICNFFCSKIIQTSDPPIIFAISRWKHGYSHAIWRRRVKWYQTSLPFIFCLEEPKNGKKMPGIDDVVDLVDPTAGWLPDRKTLCRREGFDLVERRRFL